MYLIPPMFSLRKRHLLGVLLAGVLLVTSGCGSYSDALVAAIRKDDVATVKKLLDAGTSAEGSDFDGRQPLFFARSGTVADLLIQRGAKVNVNDSAGNTPLHSAAYWGCKEVAERLIQAGANINATNHLGETPLHWAVSLLLGPPMPVFAGGEGEYASEKGKGEVTALLLTHGADPNAKTSEERMTPLHYAAFRDGTPKYIDVLVEGGAKVNEKDNWHGKTPLGMVHPVNVEIAKALERHGGVK